MTPAGWFVIWRAIVIAALLVAAALAIRIVTVVI